MKRKKCISTLVTLALTANLMILPSIKASALDEEKNLNYGEALQKSIMFYEFQRSGKLPEDKRDNWRADSAMDDGKDVGLDLTGGWYDAGDHVKFNLPMAYTSTMLAWSLYEDKDAYEESGQTKYMMDAIRWANDYFIKCHPEKDVYYYQVGDSGADHKWWGPSEVMQMDRPSYKVDKENPGSCVCGEGAASLAAASIIFKDTDAEYSETCLQHAKDLFEFADESKSDKGYTEANGYYSVSSGFWDELSWAATWLYMATNDKSYLDKAEGYVEEWGVEQQTSTIGYRWAQCWDDVHYGTQILLAKLTNKDIYKESAERNLDYWTNGYDGNRVQYTPKGLAWLSSWGSLRYATTQAFLAGVYSDWEGCTSSKVSTYKDFMESQINYALGSTGRSFEVGFGTNAPKNPHHRDAQAAWGDNRVTPNYERHVLYGALVGGPSADDSYVDDVEDFTHNEVACDYNAGFVGALAKMYKNYGGDPIKDFKSIEEKTNDEFYVEAGINTKGDNFMEIKALLYNKSGWPAKVGDKLSFRYFVDISELVDKGYTDRDVTITTNYNQGAVVSNLIPWDEENNIYYVNVDFTGTKIYPGGQPHYRKEIQFRMAAPQEVKIWDNSNDFSFESLDDTSANDLLQSKKIPVYDDGKLVYGETPKTDAKEEEPITPVLLGDINNDGEISVIDFVYLKKYLANKINAINKENSDINEDGKINILDLVKLKEII